MVQSAHSRGSSGERGEEPHPTPHSALTGKEVDEVVHAYLVESGYIHTSFSLLHEAGLGRPSSSQVNGRKTSRDDSDDTHSHVPPGHLVRILHKGLLYLEAEARYRGDPLEPQPRLVGYSIPNALPLPPLPRNVGASSTPPPPPIPGPSTSNGIHASTSKGATPPPPPPSAPTPAPKSTAPTLSSKDKGKAKETQNTPAASSIAPSASTSTLTGKRKGRTGSDRDDASAPEATTGKRARVVSANEKKKKGFQPGSVGKRGTGAAASALGETEDSSMDYSPADSPAATLSEEKSRSKASSPVVEMAPKMAKSASTQSTTSRSSKKPAASPPPSRKKTATPPPPLPKPTSIPSESVPPPEFSKPRDPNPASPPPPLSSAPPASEPVPLVETTDANASVAEIIKVKEELADSMTVDSAPTPSTSTPAPSGSLTAAPPVHDDAPEEGELEPEEEGEVQEDTTARQASKEASAPPPLATTDEDGDVSMTSVLPPLAMPPPTSELSQLTPEPTSSVESPVDPKRNDLNVIRLGGADGSVIKLKGHTVAKVQPCSWNPKVPALLATGGGDSTCRIWEVPPPGSSSDKQVAILENIVCKHSSAQRKADVAAVAWDPSGSLLATGSEDGIARIWTPSGDLHLVLSMHQRTIFSLKWNSVGTMLLTGSLDNTVCLWELSSGKVKQQWSTHSDSVLDVDWNDDQTFASASMDKSIHVFTTSRVSPVVRFRGHKDEINVVKFSPCGTILASCSDDGTVRLWSLRNVPGLNITDRLSPKDEGRLVDEAGRGGVLVLEGHTKDVHTVAWAPWTKGQTEPRLLASASFDHTTKLWDADQGTCLYTFTGHTDFVYSVAFSPGLGNYLSTGSNDGKLCIWDLKERSLVLEYTNTTTGKTDPTSGKEVAGPVYEVLWHPAGTHLAVCGQTEEVAIVGFPLGAAPRS